MMTGMNDITTEYEKFKKPNSKKIEFKNKRLPIHRLPFVGGTNGLGISFWDVPKTGGYGGGCQTGKNLALIYLKHIRENGGFSGGHLQSIVLNMFNSGAHKHDSPEETALRGQIVGFFSTLDQVLDETSRFMSGLDRFENSELLEKANIGLSFDEEAYFASLPDEDEE